VTHTELLNECIGRFGKNITRAWINSFFIRHHIELIETKSVPQENPRLEVPRDFLETTIEGFCDHVHNTCAELIFNFDEIWISE
jgi:hypothetical protein